MRIPSLLVLCLLASLAVTSLSAQEMSWRKHRKLAQQLEKEGDYFAAAENYRMAWEKKQKKEDLIYRAAENYFRLRDYRNAADAYQHVPNNYNDDQLVLLKYARALKQDGQYDKARTIFRQLSDSYTGPDKAILQDIVAVELRGIDLVRSLTSGIDPRMEILHPGVSVNSEDEEFGPASIDGSTLWFTSTMGGGARIYASQRRGRNWSKAETPAGFPLVDGGQYAHGTMSPDGQRFYFTICNNDNGWQGVNTRCELYVTKQSANGWTQPERLPEYINVEKVNTTHPNVIHQAGQEYLFFASNRENGRGGMDIWYVVRDLGLDNNDFTFPVNLGPSVNTLGDELTPYYVVDEGVLYFASNGHPGIGGFDIFKSTGSEVSWQLAVNAGLPLNSSADDFGYTRGKGGFGGFFSSNRAFGGEKTNTRHADIFEFTIGGRQISLKSNVYDQASSQLLSQISVSLYQIFEDGSENLLITKDFPTGSYLFDLLPNRRFRVEVNSAGYEPQGYAFTTDDPATFSYGQPLYLLTTDSKTDAMLTDDPMPTTGGVMGDPDAKPATTTGELPTTPDFGEAGEEYTASGSSAKDNLEYRSRAPRHAGTYYRIQVGALRRYAAGKYPGLDQYGSVHTETLVSRNLTRVLVGDFFSTSDAQSALSRVRAVYPEAYIVQYDDGVRYGRVNF
jgi:peptidoglycan-associated lipoprotein